MQGKKPLPLDYELNSNIRETQTTTNSAAPCLVATAYWSLCASTPLLIKCNFSNRFSFFVWREKWNLLLAFGPCEKHSWVWGRNLLPEHCWVLRMGVGLLLLRHRPFLSAHCQGMNIDSQFFLCNVLHFQDCYLGQLTQRFYFKINLFHLMDFNTAGMYPLASHWLP